MFILTKEFTFEAAHRLPAHDGKCARLHGHSWKMRIIVGGKELTEDGPKVGMLMDYSFVSGVGKELVESHLDHYFLNETTGLKNPTSEELARWIFNRVAISFYGNSFVTLIAVEVDETCTCSCRYEPGHIPNP